MSSVYLIMGHAGSYSDASTWPVRAFASNEEAEAWMLKLRAEHKEACIATNAAMRRWRNTGYRGSVVVFANPLDPGGFSDAVYEIVEVPQGAP